MARTTIVHVTVLLLALLAVQGPMACQADTTTTSTNKIKTVIVLMEENRSFDHMLGFIRRANQSYPANGLTGHESNPYNTSDPSGKRVYVQDEAPYVSPWDPCHSHSCTDEQIYSSSALKPTTSPSMQGFAQVGLTTWLPNQYSHCGITHAAFCPTTTTTTTTQNRMRLSLDTATQPTL